MNKKMFGLILIAAMISIVIAGIVKKNVENEESISIQQLGVDLAEVASVEGLNKGDMSPDFELKTLDGEKVQLSELKGKKVIINFWATWCAPCKAEMPHMQNYYENYAEEENVEILAVNLTNLDNGITGVKSFVQDYGLTFPIPMDVDGSVGQMYQTITIPTSYMVDTEGRIQNKILGPMDEKMMKNFISNLD
ncbi:redoxin domain-containing protein [Paenisporosarcina sp. TG20]|uniref:redoxin domain-containing protein n=1 Tax=Paenisporosarcina sp. TG20 TaxID=1211706 RepID=UPI00031B0404|nr:redoxin domain-containing protein [Paenisporosarcina sp. TG20]